jgi:phytoene/squalene synthetase
MSATALPTREAVMVQAREENFPVALRLLRRRHREGLLAIYGFARLVDDIGDEYEGDRLAALDDIAGQLDEPRHPVMRELARHDLPREPLLRLIEANRRDQVVSRYESFDELLGYCRLSAAPVGELVLHVFGVATPERIALSDKICAALQIVEHLQDVDEDAARGRFYITQPGAPELAKRLFDEGAPLIRTLRGRPRLAVAAFVFGGRRALRRLP